MEWLTYPLHKKVLNISKKNSCWTAGRRPRVLSEEPVFSCNSITITYVLPSL
jgi:hypothetical protein